MATRYFVFVEFTDPSVRSILNSLRHALAGKTLTDSAHITVRGPYQQVPDSIHLKDLSDKLVGQGVFVADTGIFETPRGYAVYLHAKSKIFDELWWKPDYPAAAARKIPHVTIFETTSKTRATAVRQFLNSEGIEIFTFGVELTVYTTKQHTLLSAEEYLNPSRKIFQQERIVVKPNMLLRAADLRTSLTESGNSKPYQHLLL